MFLDKGNTILDAAKSQSGNVSNDLMKTGQQVGAAVLGASVKYMENVASESAKTIASAAASMVIKSTVPGIVDQINKLPSAQKEEVKQIICK